MKKKDMADFLNNHFRYHVMNSWNNWKTFAVNIKLYRLNIPKEIKDTAYEMLEMQEPFDDMKYIFDEFSLRNNGIYSIRFNGRSGGYCILYANGKDSYVYSGIDFNDVDFHDIKDLYKLVKDFDETVAEAVNYFIDFCKTHRVVTKTIMVEKEIKVCEPVENTDAT